MFDTGKIRFCLPMFWQVKIKPQYVTMRSRVVRLLHTKSASDVDSRKVHHEKGHLIMHHELCQLSVISLQLLHLDRLINFLATYQLVTSTLFSSRTLSMISCLLVPKVSSVTVTHSWFSYVRSSSQKLIFS